MTTNAIAGLPERTLPPLPVDFDPVRYLYQVGELLDHSRNPEKTLKSIACNPLNIYALLTSMIVRVNQEHRRFQFESFGDGGIRSEIEVCNEVIRLNECLTEQIESLAGEPQPGTIGAGNLTRLTGVVRYFSRFGLIIADHAEQVMSAHSEWIEEGQLKHYTPDKIRADYITARKISLMARFYEPFALLRAN
jgi:hypothetical protein